MRKPVWVLPRGQVGGLICFVVSYSLGVVVSSVYVLGGTGMMITVWVPLSSGFHANSWQTTRSLSTNIPNANNCYLVDKFSDRREHSLGHAERGGQGRRG